MPSIAPFHPQIVHFAIVLLVVGLLFRWISISGRLPFAGPAAAMLLLAGTLAAVAAVRSGLDAHGPVERIPGARGAVVEHEEWGERTRNIFLVVAALARHGFLKADAFVAAGKSDSACATLQQLAAEFPADPRIKDRLARLQ